MIHVLVAVGTTQADLASVESLLPNTDGWIRLRPGAWLVATHMSATDLRDYVTTNVSVQVFAASLKGGWGTHRLPEVAEWLQGAKGWF